MISVAVILAAGMGRRLLGASEEKPKGFLTLGNRPIIVESLLMLRAHGITNVYIGTGYQRECYEDLSRQFSGVQCVFNETYAETGSMATLRLMRECVNSDFLLLESDIIYEQSALSRIIDAPVCDAILASDITSYGDEVFIDATRDSLLAGMSKDAGSIATADSILVGISKISVKTFHCMCDYFDAQRNVSMNYEDAMVGISPYIGITVCNAGPLLWCEIDTPEHLYIARQSVYPAIRRRDDLPSVTRNILLNPGPATTTDTVKYAQVVPDICPREQEFGNLLTDVSEQITELVANTAEYVTVLFGGSGTAAVESIISSVVESDGLLCVINNGAYGARMTEVATIYGLPMFEFIADPVYGIDITILAEEILNTPKRVTHLAVVHHETTTGILNDLSAIGALCVQHGIIFIVDAISSYGAIPINMSNQFIHYLAATSNKNLQGMPGISFVIANRRSLIATSLIPARNLYLNLYMQYAYFNNTSQMRFTPPVQTIYALRQALREIRMEGLETRYARYAACWEVLMDGLRGIGLECLVPADQQSKLLTTVKAPEHESYSFNEMHDILLKMGFTIYPGKLAFGGTFRIANIGAICPDDMHRFVAGLKRYFCYLNE